MEKNLTLNNLKDRPLFFRKFSRRKFAAFNSMHKVVHISVLTVTCSLVISPFSVFAQSDSIGTSKIIDLEQVDVTGQKEPLAFEEIPRLVTVVSSKEIESAPSQSISDLLRYTGNIDVRQRGKNGIQSDLSIRGGTFDQSMVLFNGTNITDPQTGHFSLFLPSEIEIIKKIEILNGSASRIYGIHAFSGAINFITSPSGNNSLTFSSSAGSYNTFSNSLTLNMASRKFRTLLYAGNTKSDGDKPNTDFKRYNVFLQQVAILPSGNIDFQFGLAQRSFGANSYYTPRFPDQFEVNRMVFTSLSYSTGNLIKIKPKIYWRRLYDRFELFREDASWYRIENDTAYSNDTANTFYIKRAYKQHNHHINDILGSDLNFEFKSQFGESNLGFHLRSENIYSTNIGYDRGIVFPVKNYPNSSYNRTDNRFIFELAVNQIYKYSGIDISGGFILNWNTCNPDELNLLPGIDVGVDLFKYLSLVGSYNYTLGLPTFTDLTYEDPNNTGNNELVPYKQHSFEAGLKSDLPTGMVAVNYFYNKGSDIIDWVWVDSLSKYKALNVPAIKSQGIEMSSFFDLTRLFDSNFPIQSIRINYSYIDMNKDIQGKITKYSNIRNMLSAMIQTRIFKGCNFSTNLSFVDRIGNYFTFDNITGSYISHSFKPYLLLDAKISYSFKSLTLYAECTNLTDKDYVDIGSVNQPGRWFMAGIKLELTQINFVEGFAVAH